MKKSEAAVMHASTNRRTRVTDTTFVRRTIMPAAISGAVRAKATSLQCGNGSTAPWWAPAQTARPTCPIAKAPAAAPRNNHDGVRNRMPRPSAIGTVTAAATAADSATATVRPGEPPPGAASSATTPTPAVAATATHLRNASPVVIS